MGATIRRYSFCLIWLFLISPVFGADNPSLQSYPDRQIMGFGGLDTKSSAPMIKDGRATDLLNVKLSSAYDLRKRYGYSVINGTLDDLDTNSPAVTGIYDANYSSGTSYTLAFVGNKLKYDNSGVWTRVPGGGTVTTGQNNQWGCVTALDVVICTNNTDKPVNVPSTPTINQHQFNGLSSPITAANAVVWFRNYLIWGNTTEGGTVNPTRFRWSDVGTTTTYTAINYTDIASLNGDQIVAFQELYGDLYIFMQKSIWKATLVGGNDIFVFSKVIDGIGAIAKGSVQSVVLPDNRLGVIFLSEDKKIYLFNGVALQNIGDVIQPTLDNLTTSRLAYATAVFDGTDYFLAVSSSSSSSKNDLLLDYQVQIGEWTKHDQIDANALARVKESTGAVKTYFGNYKAFVYWMDNTANTNDVNGVTGIVKSVGTLNTPTETGAQAIIDTGIGVGIYTGAIVRIVSGTGAGEEQVVLTTLTTGIVVTSSFSTRPTTTSNYSIGDINAYYYTKWYDFGDAPRIKSFKKLKIWGKEESSNQATITYAEDFSSDLSSSLLSFSPASGSLWGSAIWDSSTWGSTGNKIYSTNLGGRGKNIQLKFTESNINKTFDIYGFNIFGERLDLE